MFNRKSNNKMSFIQGNSPKIVEWKPSQPLANSKHERFCTEYIMDLNATQAAIRCGYSPAEAGREGWDLKQNPQIKKRIQYLEKSRLKKCKLSAQWVLDEIQTIALNYNAADYIRLRALENLAKHFMLLTDRIEINERPKRIIITDSEGNVEEELN